MKKGKYQSNHPSYNGWVVVLLLVLILLVGILIWLLLKPDPIKAELPNGDEMNTSGEVNKNPDSIAIPGYEGISLKADTKQQTVGLSNPPQNTCYFKITLMLEDGTVLWQSDLIEPGEISEAIKLNQPLKKGSYPNSLLKYECFTMDDNLSPLNSAATKLTLRVS